MADLNESWLYSFLPLAQLRFNLITYEKLSRLAISVLIRCVRVEIKVVKRSQA